MLMQKSWKVEINETYRFILPSSKDHDALFNLAFRSVQAIEESNDILGLLSIDPIILLMVG